MKHPFPPPVNYFTHAPAGYAMPLSCPRCGSTMDHVASSVPYAGTEASAIARCTRHGCHLEYQVIVHVRPAGKAHRPSGGEQRKRARLKEVAS